MSKKSVRPILSCFLALFIFLLSCTSDKVENDIKTTSTGQDTYIPVYEPCDCLFTVPQGVNVECGCLTVPEDRSQPDGNKVKLHVAIFKTEYPDPAPDPIVYLAGGPGEYALESTSLIFQKRFSPLMANRDLVIFDQRGTGYSEPPLDCPELVELNYSQLDQDLSNEEALSMEIEALTECYERLKNQGINLSAYNSAENAADLNDLRIALGYEEWNLLGISYGTRLALTAMRDFPEGIRSVILNSTVPLQQDFYTGIPGNIDRSLNVLFDLCKNDPKCNKVYPDLENALYEVITDLDETPVSFVVTHPLTVESYDVLINGGGFFNFIISALYSTDAIPLIPKVIDDGKAGNFDTLALLLGSRLLDMELISSGMHYSVQCYEEIPFSTPEDFNAAVENYPDMKKYLESSIELGGEFYDICDCWVTDKADPMENEPVTSDIPTLILAGEFDPVTPPSWGKQASETLENSYFYEFRGLSHDTIVSGNECVLDIALEFLDNPGTEPVGSCSEETDSPEFVTLDVNLKPFTSEMFGFKGVYPEDWIEVAPGTYTRSNLGFTAIAQQVVPGVNADTLLGMFKGMLKLGEIPEKSSSRTANGVEWSIYQIEVQGTIGDIAIAEGEGLSYFILFTCVPYDHEYYYKELLLPAIDALALAK